MISIAQFYPFIVCCNCVIWCYMVLFSAILTDKMLICVVVQYVLYG